MFCSNLGHTQNITQIIQICSVGVCFACVLSDWDGIMERDNQQGEAEGVTICDPPSESNPSGKRARSLELFKKIELM